MILKLNRFLSKNKNFVYSTIIVGVVFFAFYKLLFCYFHQDDFGAFSWAMMTELDKSLLFARWTGYVRLGENIFFVLYNKLFGLNAVPAYIFSIIIQILNAVLVYIFASILTENKNIGLISSLLFAVGYAHGETVTFLAPMTQGGFLGILWLVSLLLFIRYLRRGGRKTYFCSLVAFVFSLMVKESAALLIPMLFLYDIMFSPQGRKVKIPTFFPRYLPFLMVLTIYKLFFLVSLPMGGEGAPAMQALHSGGLVPFAVTCVTILLSNMALLIIPSPIINEILPQLLWRFISLIFILLVMDVVLFTKRDKRYSRPVWYALLWTVVNLTPYSLLWPLEGYEGGRYLFISSMGISIIITMLIYGGYIKLKRLLKANTLGLIISRCTLTVVIGGILFCNIVLLQNYEDWYIKEGDRKKGVIENLYSYYNKFPDNSVLYLEGDDLPFSELVIPGGILSVLYHNRGGDTLRKERNFATALSLLAQGKYSIDRLYAFSYDRGTGRLENKTEELRNILRNTQVLNYDFNKDGEKPTLFSWKASNPYQIKDGYLSTTSLEKTVQLKILSEPLTLGIHPIIYGPDEQLPAIIPYQIEMKMRISPRRLAESKFPYLRLSSHQPYFDVTSIPSLIDLNQLSHFYAGNFIGERFLLNYEHYQEEDKFRSISEYKDAQREFRLHSIVYSSSDLNAQCSAKNILDGEYGDENIWVPFYFVGGSWIKIDLQEEKIINRVIWSRDRTGQYKDRIPIDYTIQTSLNDKDWTVVKTVQDDDFTIRGNYAVDDFEPIEARYVKMEITETKGGFWAPAIDEFEVVEAKFAYIKDFDKLEGKFYDPFVFVSGCKEAEEIYEAIGIRGKAKIFWLISGGNDWDGKNSKEFEVILDSKFHLYQIEINAGDLISGKIQQLRLNPFNIPGSVDIDYIKIKPKILNTSK